MIAEFRSRCRALRRCGVLPSDRDSAGTVARPTEAQGEAQATFERLRSGLAFARRDPRVRLLLGGQSLALILFTLIIPIEVIYAKESLGTTSAGFGILLASWGAGIVFGSILFVSVRNRSAAGLILLSTAAIGLAYLGMAGAQSLFVACLLSVLGRNRQRHPVGVGDDRAPGGDPQRLSGARRGAAGVSAGGDARRRLSDRRHPHGRMVAAHRVRRGRHRHARARARRTGRTPRSAARATRHGARRRRGGRARTSTRRKLATSRSTTGDR